MGYDRGLLTEYGEKPPVADKHPVRFRQPRFRGRDYELNEANPFDYLTQLQRHARELAAKSLGVDAVELP